jgi:WD40 repeat protein
VVDSGRLKHTFTGHQGQVLSVAWSPDDRHLATVGQDRTLRIWAVREGSTAGGYQPEGLPVKFQEARRSAGAL